MPTQQDAAAPIRPPRQARAQRTLERILDTTERLLEERPFEAISVAEIVRSSKTSVGAFYSRFRDKDALLPALYERYDDWVGKHVARLQSESPWTGLELSGVADWVVDQLIALFEHRRFLMRAMTLHARARPEKIDAATRERRARQMSFLREALLAHRDAIGHADPERAVDFAIFTAASACRELILFADAPHASSIAADPNQLRRDIAHQLLSFLQHSPS